MQNSLVQDLSIIHRQQLNQDQLMLAYMAVDIKDVIQNFYKANWQYLIQKLIKKLIKLLIIIISDNSVYNNNKLITMKVVALGTRIAL
jgi:hypothetical protein